jgi:flagellin-like hook-associated protein FlgL
LNAAIATLQNKSSELSANLSTLNTRQSFTTLMVNTLTIGATQLTEADTNEEGANLLALQTKQSLGTTALSISSQAEQSILRLF